jgi:mediator of RNA polymerase II transcription subunit 5
MPQHSYLWTNPPAVQRFTSLAASLDAEPLSQMCRIFYTYEVTLDIITLQTRISDLIFRALSFLEHYDCETVGNVSPSKLHTSNLKYPYMTLQGDPQTAVSHLGDVVLFVQYATARFHVSFIFPTCAHSYSHIHKLGTKFISENKVLSSHFLATTEVVQSVDHLSAEDIVAFQAWSKALFDSNSEGIEDSILR